MTLLLLMLLQDDVPPPTTYEVDVRAGLLGLGWTRLVVIEALLLFEGICGQRFTT
jgi:hypothetical protein